VPCDDNDQSGTGPVDLRFARWLQGTRPEQASGYVDTVTAAWKARGWDTDDNANPGIRRVRATTGDGYTLIMTVNDMGYLSLAGSSPCFPRANAEPGTPMPATILHPQG